MDKWVDQTALRSYVDDLINSGYYEVAALRDAETNVVGFHRIALIVNALAEKITVPFRRRRDNKLSPEDKEAILARLQKLSQLERGDEHITRQWVDQLLGTSGEVGYVEGEVGPDGIYRPVRRL